MIFLTIVTSLTIAAATDAPLTVTQDLIRREVIALDGIWEGAGNRVRLVAFLGPKFTNGHFEMLEHLQTIEQFYCSEVPAKPECLKALSATKGLRYVEIVGCGQLIDGLPLVGQDNLKEIELLRANDCKVSTTVFETIQIMTKLKTLELSDVEFKPADIRLLEQLKSLKQLVVISTI